MAMNKVLLGKSIADLITAADAQIGATTSTGTGTGLGTGTIN